MPVNISLLINRNSYRSYRSVNLHGAAPLLTAQLAVVVLGNESKTVAWIEDSSIAAFIAHLTAHSLGLGSCWIQVRGREYTETITSEAFVRETLNIPDGVQGIEHCCHWLFSTYTQWETVRGP